MAKRRQRIKNLFKLLPPETELSYLQIWEIVGGFWGPVGDIDCLVIENYLTRRFIPGPYPRKALYKKADRQTAEGTPKW
jgi:hypothetical protein